MAALQNGNALNCMWILNTEWSFGCHNSWKWTSLSENEHIPDYCFSYQILCPNTQSYNYNVFFSIIYLISYIYWYCTYFCLKILHIPYKCFYNHNLCPHDPIILLHGRLTQKGNKNQASDCFGSKHKIWCSCLNCVGADGNHVILLHRIG